MSELVQAGATLPVWPDGTPSTDLWQDAGPELERPLRGNSRLVRNVSQPTLTVFLPEPAAAIGTGVVICPGGAFHFLMVDKEGSLVARWLNARGLAAFVLRYRVAPTPDDDDAFNQQVSDLGRLWPRMQQVRPLAVADGLQALRLVKQQAAAFGVASDRVGILGFSAGGVVASGAATEYGADNRPSFAAPIYAWSNRPPRPDAPPLFLAAATDDQMVDAQRSVDMYTAWKAAGLAVELHLYEQGGHGFGMNQQGLPSDHWIDRFWDWLSARRFAG
jgi:acetyl esterase/lipase